MGSTVRVALSKEHYQSSTRTIKPLKLGRWPTAGWNHHCALCARVPVYPSSPSLLWRELQWRLDVPSLPSLLPIYSQIPLHPYAKNMVLHSGPHACKRDGKALRITCRSKSCTAGFTTKHGFNRHCQSVHKLGKPIDCEVPGCNEVFTRKVNMIQHLRTVHEAYVPIKKYRMKGQARGYGHWCSCFVRNLACRTF